MMQLSDQEFIQKADEYRGIMQAVADPTKSPEEIKALAEEILAFSRQHAGPLLLTRSDEAKLAYISFKRELYRQLYSVDNPRRGHAVH